MQCKNDFCNSKNIWINYDTGDYVCHDCGCCIETVMLHQIQRSEIFTSHNTFKQGFNYQDPFKSGSMAIVHRKPIHRKRKRKHVVRRKNKSSTYKRLVYFREKISQWRCQEPVIPYDDWEYIYDYYHENRRPVVNTRKQVTNLLKRIKNRWPDYCKHFVKKYGERWRQIRFRLTGVKSTGMFRIVDSKLINRLIKDFNSIERYYAKNGTHNNKKRKSLISYNMIIRLLLKKYGLGYLIYDIPILKSKNKRNEIINAYEYICTKI